MSMITFKEWRALNETDSAELAHGGMKSPADVDDPEARRLYFDRNKKRPPTFGMSVKSPEELTAQEPEQAAPGQLPGYSSDVGTHTPNVGDPKGKAYLSTLLQIHKLERHVKDAKNQIVMLKKGIGL